MHQETGSAGDRRRHIRYSVDNVFGQVRTDSAAQVLDLSVSGISIETQAWLQVGREYTIRIASPDEPLVARGRVAWSRFLGSSHDGGAIYRAGLQFQTFLSEDRLAKITRGRTTATVTAEGITGESIEQAENLEPDETLNADETSFDTEGTTPSPLRPIE